MGQKLTQPQREFLTLVSKAAFANPFSDEREQADLQIVGISPKSPEHKVIEAVLAKVRAFLGKLDGAKANIKSYDEPDRSLIETAWLFDVFHTYHFQFDELILKQVETADASCTVPFAKEALQALTQRGFTKQESLRFFAMFYQIRRAFYFVNCSLVGDSECMRQLRRALWNNVFTCNARTYTECLWDRMEDFSTLLIGETGTGKGSAAAAIGRSGFIPFNDKQECFAENFTETFIAINFSQFPESIIESELFGHRKGAFTGATEAHKGVFARCSTHGAIFLDEIGDAGIPIQIKLLKILQERTFSPVGSHEIRRFNGRVIAASNKPIDDLRREKLFREDFFYRLCSDIIHVPTLRQCINEDPSSLDQLLEVITKKIMGETPDDLVPHIRDTIRTSLGPGYQWPGNVRELEQCVRRILLTGTYHADRISVSPDLRSRMVSELDAGTCSAQELLVNYCRLLYSSHGTYEEVSRRTGLDRRTVKKYIT